MNYSKSTLKNSSNELNSVTKKQPKLKLNFNFFVFAFNIYTKSTAV